MAKVLEKQFPSIPMPTQDPAALLKTVAALKEAVELLTGQRTAKSESLIDAVRDLRSSREGFNARFTEYVEVSTSNDRALARRTTTLEAQTAQSAARIEEVDTARADADQALAQQYTALSAEIDGVDARVTTEVTARANADQALASDIQQLQTTYGNFTAGGRVAFTTVANASGATSTYEITVKASDGDTPRLTGLRLEAKTDGTAAITFTASQFRLYDPAGGSGLPVFNYSAGLFTFNVPVRLFGQQLEDYATFQVASAIGTSASDNLRQAGLIVRSAASIVEVDADFAGAPTQPFLVGSTPGRLTVSRAPDGGAFTPIVERFIPYAVTGSPPNQGVYYSYVRAVVHDQPGPGVWIYRVETNLGIGPVAVVLKELYK